MEKSREVRAFCKGIVAMVPPLATLELQDNWLRNKASDVQIAEANRLAKSEYTIVIENGGPLYHVACLALVILTEQVQPGEYCYGVHPFSDTKTMARIQILVDLFARQHGFYRDWKSK